jgi:predicted RNase H-like HicB family nuclease
MAGEQHIEQERQFEVVLMPQPEGGYVVSVPELPGVVTEGETRDEALAMAKDAIEGYLETMRERGWSVPTGERERVVIRTG